MNSVFLKLVNTLAELHTVTEIDVVEPVQFEIPEWYYRYRMEYKFRLELPERKCIYCQPSRTWEVSRDAMRKWKCTHCRTLVCYSCNWSSTGVHKNVCRNCYNAHELANYHRIQLYPRGYSVSVPTLNKVKIPALHPATQAIEDAKRPEP